MPKLNPQQHAAVRYIDGPCLVLAGAGSGKTSVITQKIRYLIEECGYPARTIAALTFTNKAAREMKERVGQLVGKDQIKGLTVSTFHTLGLKILRREHKHAGLRSSFSLLDSEDSRAILKELILQEGDTDPDLLDLLANTISRWKNRSTMPEKALESAESDGDKRLAIVYAAYQKALRAYNAVDFDDLITLPLQLLHTNQEILERWQSRIRYLLIDEYQDTNWSQYQLIKTLLGSRGGLTVVGDDDQSIYAWRGAEPENLNTLATDYPSLKVIKLEQNYRSSTCILNAANTLIANNPHEYSKKLWSDRGEGDRVRVVACANEDAEAERAVTEILAHKARHRKGYSHYAILYRSNHQARLLEMKLQQHQVPYQMSGGVSFFSRTEVKDIMAYLKLLSNPEDDTALLRIINTPRRQIGSSTLQKLGEHARERDLTLLQAAEEFSFQQQLSESAKKHLNLFVDWIRRKQDALEESDAPMSLIDELLEDIDYLGWLHQNASSTTVAERRWENIEFLRKSLLRSIERDEEEGDEPSLSKAIQRLLLLDILERQEEEDESYEAVQLMTIHSSKGLEFPFVVFIGIEEDILPHKNSTEEAAIQEERRLAYVGITRAKEELVMTYAKQRKQYGEKQITTRSRFVDELPADELIFEGSVESSEQDKQRLKEKGMANIMKLFG